jgi:hypothetical protein
MATDCHATSAEASAVASGRATRNAWVIVATATNTRPTSALAAAPLAIHAAGEPGSRCAARTPPTPPTIDAVKAADRSR